jgi:hypothetical protein
VTQPREEPPRGRIVVTPEPAVARLVANDAETKIVTRETRILVVSTFEALAEEVSQDVSRLQRLSP